MATLSSCPITQNIILMSLILCVLISVCGKSAHTNDKNEDWVNKWATERRYPEKGNPTASLMQENWQVKDGKVVRFNQYTAKQ
jgi:hypothetical protein